MTNKEQKLRELVNGISAFTTRKELMERITALISEGYVSKKAYNVIKEHYQSALAAKDINRDYINKYYYPKEFVEWLFGHSLVWDEKTMTWFTQIERAFNYWKENCQ